eukprot:2406418-Amphidinium_carterae.1
MKSFNSFLVLSVLQCLMGFAFVCVIVHVYIAFAVLGLLALFKDSLQVIVIDPPQDPARGVHPLFSQAPRLQSPSPTPRRACMMLLTLDFSWSTMMGLVAPSHRFPLHQLHRKDRFGHGSDCPPDDCRDACTVMQVPREVAQWQDESVEYTFAGLSAGLTYRFRVSVNSEVGYSDASSITSIVCGGQSST